MIWVTWRQQRVQILTTAVLAVVAAVVLVFVHADVVSLLPDRTAVREREIHDGLRSMAPVSYIETRTLAIGPYYGISVRRTFGG